MKSARLDEEKVKNSVETPSLAGRNFKVPLEISSVELEMIDAFEFSAAAW